MLVIGAKGHAREILQVLRQRNQHGGVYFYDDVSADLPDALFGEFPILRSLEAARALFARDNRFILGLGKPALRLALAARFRDAGGVLTSVVSPFARIGDYGVALGEGLNVMDGAFISNGVTIGEGTLVNAGAAVHHDAHVGDYCEISPGARILGGCVVGRASFIGASATILPAVRIGNHVVVGAGAVVTRDVPDDAVVAGVPARPLQKKQS